VVELNGTLLFSDVLKFQYSQCYRYTWWLVLLFMLVTFVGVLLALVVAVLTPELELARRAGTWFLVLLIFWIFIATAPYRSAKRQMKTSIPLSGQILYVFSSQGIHSSGAHFSSDISYEVLWAVRETKSMFALYASASYAFVVPKRFFNDATQENDWRILVEEHISPKVITKSGFLGRWL
jgi:YcxB-like protein